jgi:hypothetical protein
MNNLSIRVLALTLVATGCKGDPTGPEYQVEPTPTISRLERDFLGASMRYATEQSLLALSAREAGARVSEAFAALAERLEKGDRAGAIRAIATARRMVSRYREIDGEAGDAAPELEAMTLTLDQTEARLSENSVSSADTTAGTKP